MDCSSILLYLLIQLIAFLHMTQERVGGGGAKVHLLVEVQVSTYKRKYSIDPYLFWFRIISQIWGNKPVDLQD